MSLVMSDVCSRPSGQYNSTTAQWHSLKSSPSRYVHRLVSIIDKENVDTRLRPMPHGC